jgi:hypothetical protein
MATKKKKTKVQKVRTTTQVVHARGRKRTPEGKLPITVLQRVGIVMLDVTAISPDETLLLRVHEGCSAPALIGWKAGMKVEYESVPRKIRAARKAKKVAETA